MTELVLTEVFGPTVQGEGPSLGRRAAFVRTGRCNLSCRWCDTPFTWDWSGLLGTVYDPSVETYRTTPGAVAGEVAALGVGLVVITGGEPLVQPRGVAALADLLIVGGMDVEVETNGTRPPLTNPAGVRYNVSPKLAHSGDSEAQRIHPEVLTAFAALETTAFKFVARSPADLDEVAEVCALARIPDRQVWVMPEGVATEVLDLRLGMLATEVVQRGWNLTTRLHVQAWGNRRGV